MASSEDDNDGGLHQDPGRARLLYPTSEHQIVNGHGSGMPFPRTDSLGFEDYHSVTVRPPSGSFLQTRYFLTMTRIQVNGQLKDVNVPENMPLLWVLRDELGMTGTKFGCGMALCGACTVHMDDSPIRSCVTPVSAVAGHAISTVEGIESDRVGQVVQQAWIESNVAQCGYCQGGQIMSAVGLLKTTPTPTDDQINAAMSGNICRCGTYPRIHAAIKLAASRLAQGSK